MESVPLYNNIKMLFWYKHLYTNFPGFIEWVLYKPPGVG